jgi:CSLREA domain-containing protein
MSPSGLASSNPADQAPIENVARNNPAIEFSISEHSIVINTTDDEENNNGNCSLREAIRAANLDEPVDACRSGRGVDEIFVAAGVYHVATVAPLDIRTDLALVGAGPGESIIQVNGPISSDLITSAFNIANVNFSISNMSIYREPELSDSSSLN